MLWKKINRGHIWMFQLFIVVIMILAFLGANSSSDHRMTINRAEELLNDSYSEFTIATEKLLNYDVGSAIKKGDGFEALNKQTSHTGERIMSGDFYVLYSEVPFEADLIPDGELKRSLAVLFSSDALVDVAFINEKNIQYQGIERYNPVRKGFWGYYYSMDGSPQIVTYPEENILVENGGGWSISTEIANYYYTENIRDKFYYYEGKFSES